MAKEDAPVPDIRRQKVEEEIVATTALIQIFHKKIYELKEELNATTWIMTRLPLETLTEIFFLVNESGDTESKTAIPSPFILGRVCRAWRKLAWSTPRLWSIISISFSTKRQEAQRILLKEWLARSSGHPLHIHICRPMPKSNVDPDNQEPPLETLLLLLTCSSQWRAFTVSLVFGSFPGLCYELSSEFYHFPNLQNVTIYGRTQASLLWNFSSPPQLRTVRLDRWCRPSNLCIDWSTVHRLDTTLGITQCMSVLLQASSLKRLNFDVDHDEDNILRDATTQPIDLVTLHQVTLRSAVKGQNFDMFFGKVSLPALQSLSVEVRLFSRSVQWWPFLIDMIGRSRCPLTSLSIASAGNPSGDDILSILRILPSLQHFTLRATAISSINRIIFSDLLVDFLALPRQGFIERPVSECLPSLKSFSFKGDIKFKPEGLLSMIESRRIEHRPNDPPTTTQVLESLKITYHNKSWAQEQDPNVMQHFYVSLARMGSFGTKVDIAWVPPASPLSA